jgi:hypothetical protein
MPAWLARHDPNMVGGLAIHAWGGEDLNLRPTDYEFDPDEFGDQPKVRKIAHDQGVGYAELPIVSHRFAVDRGTHAGHRRRKGVT